MKLLSQNIKPVLIGILFFLLIINYNSVLFGIDSDFFGIFFSVLLFFVGGRKTNFKVNYLLIGLIVVFEFVSYQLHTKSLHFLSLTLLICLIYYYFTKKFSFIALICILLFSTIFNKFFEHLTTEIKQELCKSVYLTLKNFIKIDKIEGVTFYINGAKITIDTACMGLSMFKTGLLTGAILLTLEERKQQHYFSVFQIIFFCMVIIFLNIISNYFRIITLILLDCTEENVLHHSIGLICFLLYQVVPMLLIIRYIKPKKEEAVVLENHNKLLPIIIALVLITVTTCEMKNEKNLNLLSNLNPKYDIKKGEWVNKEVFKIQSHNKLIYIKTPSHKPLICWTGAGYKITESKEICVEGKKVWFNIMEKDHLQYQSIWWYECGEKKYTSFVEAMLMKLVYGETIRLINETVPLNVNKS